MNAGELKDMQEVVEDAKANALRFPEISLDDLEALVKLGFECLKLREAQRWIPVSERLPEFEEKVLIRYSGVALEAIRVDEFDDDAQEDFAWWSDPYDGEWLNFCEVTHWMPLPEAPAGEQA